MLVLLDCENVTDPSLSTIAFNRRILKSNEKELVKLKRYMIKI